MPDTSRMPQIDSLKAGQQTIQVVAGCIHPKPKVKALAPLSILHSIPVPGRRHIRTILYSSLQLSMLRVLL
jgi:hypothetical protein